MSENQFLTLEGMFGLWAITTTWGAEYEVQITEVGNTPTYKGLSFSGPFRYDGEQFGVGCFPLCDIKKMLRIA